MRSNVVLPQPDGPSSAKNSPGAMSRLTLSTATVEPQRRDTEADDRLDVYWLIHLTHPCGYFCPLPCIIIISAISTMVTKISMVDAALTSGVTEKRNIE